MIDDYITLYDIKKKCGSDIKKRGVTFEEKNCKGELVQKENPSVKNLINTNKQMLSIIDKLKLDPEKIIPEDDGELRYDYYASGMYGKDENNRYTKLAGLIRRAKSSLHCAIWLKEYGKMKICISTGNNSTNT